MGVPRVVPRWAVVCVEIGAGVWSGIIRFGAHCREVCMNWYFASRCISSPWLLFSVRVCSCVALVLWSWILCYYFSCQVLRDAHREAEISCYVYMPVPGCIYLHVLGCALAHVLRVVLLMCDEYAQAGSVRIWMDGWAGGTDGSGPRPRK